MNLPETKTEMRLQVWASPGEHQTLDDIIELYKEQVIEIDRRNDRILVGESIQDA